MKNIPSLTILGILSSFIIGCLASPARADEIPFFGIFPLIAQKTWYISNGWSNGKHQSCEWSKNAVKGHEKNLRLILSDKAGKTLPYTCGEIQTNKKYSYGRYEARIKTAAGSGLNSAFFTFVGPYQGSKIHDEIDIEFLGKDGRLVQFSYWHDAKNYDAKVYTLDFDATTDFHDYAFEWHKDKIIWFVNGKEVHRTSGKHPLPFVPSKIMFSLWSGGKPVDDWMGPFKYKGPQTMDISWVKFTPFEN